MGKPATTPNKTMLSNILSLGPASLISEYDGGRNFMFFGALSKDVRASWSLSTKTSARCVFSSITRMNELPLGKFRTTCFIRGLVCAVDNQQWEVVEWIVPRLPEKYALYSDALIKKVLETGVVRAIEYTISVRETKVARPIFRIAAVNAVHSGHTDAAKYLCTRFKDGNIRQECALAASLSGDFDLIKWCAGIMRYFPPAAIRALVYRGDVGALEWLMSTDDGSLTSDQLVLYAALGGHIAAVDWLLDNTVASFNAEEVCLMVCAKGLLGVLKHLVVRRGFGLNRSDCIRFAKKGSGVACWLLTHVD